MIYTYQASVAGPYHIKHGIPCQDACYVAYGSDGIVVAAVADGLGSELHSDVGATIASEIAVNHCAENIAVGMMKEEVLAVIKESFERAYKAVVAVARAEAVPAEIYPEDEYDCTLCLAVFHGTKLYYGQSGDSGMIARLVNGAYVRVTEQQRDAYGRVYPLAFGDTYWKFNSLDGDVSSVMLMTDGLWEELCPASLTGNGTSAVDEAMAKQYLNLDNVKKQDLPVLENMVKSYLEKYPEEFIDDDKTLVVMFHEKRTSPIYDKLYQVTTDFLCKALDWKRSLFSKEVQK